MFLLKLLGHNKASSFITETVWNITVYQEAEEFRAVEVSKSDQLLWLVLLCMKTV